MSAGKLFLMILLAAVAISAYEIPDETEEVALTCRIHLKLQVIPDKEMQMATGRGIVTATLTDDEGNPYRQEKVRFSANAGTFTCKLSGDTLPSTSAEQADCFSTGFDGVAKVYLVNIPFNTQIRVTAAYDCDGRMVSSSGTMSISRGIAKKKIRVVPNTMK